LEGSQLKAERILITGGAGFIGSNLAHRLLEEGHEVILFDNLSRSGRESNLEWLTTMHGSSAFRLVRANLTDFSALQAAAAGVERIYHLAGQVAVTTSVQDPRHDFESNALGTFNVLEAARCAANPPIVLYASTNKVYGDMQDVAIREEATRYAYIDLPHGVPETHPLDFLSPYGCSKGTGDQYVRDYARIYKLRTVVMRQSCIYGDRQLGGEEQGWLAWFIKAALKQQPITIYGNGKQVRDVLFIDDLLNAYAAVVHNIEHTAGQIYNIGGGVTNTLSVWAEFGPQVERLLGRPVTVTYHDWRPGDQRVYISDIRKAEHELHWHPQVFVQEGVERLFHWIQDNHEFVA
jgi:CDP-paratose 2-epimerase